MVWGLEPNVRRAGSVNPAPGETGERSRKSGGGKGTTSELLEGDGRSWNSGGGEIAVKSSTTLIIVSKPPHPLYPFPEVRFLSLTSGKTYEQNRKLPPLYTLLLN
jgi:hypothetical protein